MAKTDQTKPITISILIISLVFAIINTSGHVKQVASIIAAYILTGHYEYVNITNILYCILGAVFMFVPINILVRTKTMTAKTRMVKYTYFFISESFFPTSNAIPTQVIVCVLIFYSISSID